jgi:hypothetical protein
MKRLTSIDQLRATARKRRALKRAPKPKVRVNYGRRVRNVQLVNDTVATVAVRPHVGPKPKVYPKINWTPLAWRTT